MSCPTTIRRWRSASRARPADRRTCCSTTASPSTCRAATWRSAAKRSSRSAASIRSTCAPATTWTCAGGCRRGAGRSGFRGAALVWHHHRSSITAYWRQQVGYGEGETWLMAHHPEKFLDGRMLWRGRIYSPLPFVRSLSGTKINAGVWGTAAFPSVYRTDVHPFAFLPHSIRWQVMSFVLAMAGLAVALRGRPRLGGGAPARHRPRSASRPRSPRTSPTRSDRRWTRCPGSKLWYRAAVAYLHFIQPIARLSRADPRRPFAAAKSSCRTPLRRPAVARGRRCARPGARFCCCPEPSRKTASGANSGRPPSACCRGLTDWLRRSRAVRTIEIDDGWSDDRDLSIPVGRWAWLDARALVEDHGSGKSLLRVSTHLRPTILGVVGALALGLALFVAAAFGVALRWPPAGAITGGLTIVVIAAALWRTAQATAILRRSIARVTIDQGMQQMPSGPARAPLLAPSLLRMYGLRSATIFVAHDPVARREHVHAARGGHRSRSSAARRVTPAITVRPSRRGSTRPEAWWSRRTATSTSPTPTTT